MYVYRPHNPPFLPFEPHELTSVAADEPAETSASSDDNNNDEEDDEDANLNTAATLDPDATQTGSSSGGSKGNSTRTGKESFDPTDPPGGASFVTPDIRAGPALYKAGDEVTFVWNYTNVLAEPTAVDVLLSCTSPTALWTLTGNMSFQDPATYVWDSSVQKTDASQPLLTEEYILIVKDSEVDVDATAENGYFTRQDLGIAIYLPRDPTPMDEWNCPTCSGGPPELDHKALGFAATMCVITALSFTWFVTGLNL